MNIVNMIKFQLKLMCKTPIMFMMFFVYPVLLTAIIGYLTQSSFGGGVSSYEYYSIGMMIFIFTSSGLISSYNFLDENVKQGNVRTMFTPVKNLGIYLSEIISGTIYSSVAIAITMLIFSLLFGVNYNGNGILICVSFVIVLCILGGAFFSLEALGEIPAMISKISPVKWLMDGLLNSMYDNNNFILFVIIGINIIIAVMLIGLTSKTFKTEKYL